MNFIQDGSCPEEKISRGDLGPVSNDEQLVRIVRSPQHIVQQSNRDQEKGSLKLGLFSQTDIKSRGVSITRSSKVEKGWLLSYANAVAKDSVGETLQGLQSASTLEVRSENLTDGHRAFCVIEDPAIAVRNIPNNPAHAIIVASTSIEDASEIIKLQQALFRLFKSAFSLKIE